MTNPNYPIYIPSKGRWESRLTVKALDKMSIPYYIVIEPQEYDNYASVIDPDKILVLPFSNLGKGSIPARCWIMEHSIRTGVKRHWQVDDNISCFYWKKGNNYHKVTTGITFKIVEDFTDRYENIAYSGMQYHMFAPKKQYSPGPILLNTRIYSCILINNIIPYRWRGKYNEDTDVSLMALKDGWCTVLFYAFLIHKQPTMKIKGGNTEALYKLDNGQDGRLQMARELMHRHPDVVKITRKWGRWQHQVDYRPFKHNKLIPKPGVEIPDGVNNYGMVLVNLAE